MFLMRIIAALLVSASVSLASATNDLPRFQEIYKLLRENMDGVSGSALDQAAVKGLLHELKPQALLADATAGTSSNSTGLVRSSVLDGSFVYFQVSSVTEQLADKLAATYRDVAATNKSKIKGVVLDLRFATGFDYAAAGHAADDFFNSEQPLLTWGTASVRATRKADAMTVPVAVLINHETAGAAEALAAILRDTNVGLLIGGASAGQANVYKSFPLTNGEKLRIATAQIKVADKKVLAAPLKPDIAVLASDADAKAWMADPFKVLHKPEVAKDADADSIATESATVGPSRRRMNEAELVREQREGLDPEAELAVGGGAKIRNDAPHIEDPVLVRALDLLKGLAIVQR
jgi:hypothetical protein